LNILLPTLAIAFAAFCVWLTVRIINRRERWAKWTLAVTLSLPVLYVASFGLACWLTARSYYATGSDDGNAHPVMIVYWPLGYAGAQGPRAVSRLIFRYAWLGVGRDEYILLMRSSDRSQYLPPRKN